MAVLPITPARIARDARAIGVEAGDVLLVHTSLSAIGGKSMVAGGAVGVIEGLLEAVGARGTLVMPAFSADYSDPASWTNLPVPAAWWPSLREGMPAWRADRARTFRIGEVAETFRAFDGVLRSEHPQCSFCALGPAAEALLAAVPLDDPLGPDGPLGRLRDRGAKVLLAGCGFRACTAFHLAEHECARPPARVSAAAPVLRDGERVWARWSEPAYDASRFATIGAVFARVRGACRAGRVGAAEASLFPLADGVAFATAWLDRER